MRLTLAILALTAAPAVAAEVTFTEDDAGVTLTYHNELTMWDALSEETFRFETSRGVVTMLLHRTQNSSCEPVPCADWLEVIETPEGTVAIPAQVELPELGTTTVRVVQFNGI